MDPTVSETGEMMAQGGEMMAPTPAGDLAWLDGALLAVGLPEAMISVPVVVMCALLSAGVVDVVKSYAPRGEVDGARWQWGWRLVAVLFAALLGALSASLGRVTLAQGLYLGLAAGVASPLIWHAARRLLRARGVR